MSVISSLQSMIIKAMQTIRLSMIGFQQPRLYTAPCNVDR